MTILRAVDIQNPKTPALWYGVERPASLGTAVGDVLRAYAHLATCYDIRLTEAIQLTLDKLAARQHQPDVMAQANAADAAPISSRRPLSLLSLGCGT